MGKEGDTSVEWTWTLFLRAWVDRLGSSSDIYSLCIMYSTLTHFFKNMQLSYKTSSRSLRSDGCSYIFWIWVQQWSRGVEPRWPRY